MGEGGPSKYLIYCNVLTKKRLSIHPLDRQDPPPPPPCSPSLDLGMSAVGSFPILIENVP